MKTTLVFLISTILFSCNSKKEVNEKAIQNTNRVWMLAEFQDFKKEDLIKKEAQLDLRDSIRATVKMGCNSLSFTYKIKKDFKITFTSGISTMMACEDMQLEDKFSTAITKITSYKIEGHTLTLLNEAQEKMVFVAQDWD